MKIEEYKKQFSYFVYIIRRESKNTGKISYYVGYTKYPSKRYQQHHKYTCNKGYILHGMTLIAGFNKQVDAMREEKRVKKHPHNVKAMLYKCTIFL